MYNRKHRGGTEKASTNKQTKKTKPKKQRRHETPGLKMSPTPALYIFICICVHEHNISYEHTRVFVQVFVHPSSSPAAGLDHFYKHAAHLLIK